MALTRKMLKAMGIEDEKIDQIIEAHTETVDALKTDRDKFKEEAEKLPNVQKELDALRAAADKDDKDPFKVKYEAIKEEFETYKKDISEKETAAKKQAAFRALLKEVGISEKRIDSVLKVSDLGKIELDENGGIKDADTLKESTKQEWSDFIVTSGTAGANPANPPASPSPDYDNMSDADYYKATYEAAKNKK